MRQAFIDDIRVSMPDKQLTRRLKLTPKSMNLKHLKL